MTKFRSSASSAGVPPAPSTTTQVGRGIALAAGIIAVGNIVSSILGMVRNSVIARLFGGTPLSSGYYIASAVPNTLYDLLVGGLVSAALVPVFSELAEHDERELGRVAGVIFSFLTLVMTLAAMAVWLLAPRLGSLLTSNAANGQQIAPYTITLIRWMAPALVFMALTGLLTGLSQARRRFVLPALAIGLFNIGMIVCGLALHRQLGVRSLALGMVVGAGAQAALLAQGLRAFPLRLNLDLGHPAVRRILRLYAPVALGIGFSVLGTVIDRRLASGVATGAAAIMGYATTLIQFGLGVITSAIALAALPTLSRQSVDPNDLPAYRRTLAWSLKSVLLLILPAAVGLAVLAEPIVRVIFQHGAFTPSDARLTTVALLLYAPSMIAAAIDQPLIFAFYARKNTLLPNLVQGAAIATYLFVAWALVRSLGMWGLILGNVAQWSMHALIMLVLAQRQVQALTGQRLGEALAKGILASAGMGLVLWGSNQLWRGVSSGFGLSLLHLAVNGALGIGVYAALAATLRIEAWAVFASGLRNRLGRS